MRLTGHSMTARVKALSLVGSVCFGVLLCLSPSPVSAAEEPEPPETSAAVAQAACDPVLTDPGIQTNEGCPIEASPNLLPDDPDVQIVVHEPAADTGDVEAAIQQDVEPTTQLDRIETDDSEATDSHPLETGDPVLQDQTAEGADDEITVDQLSEQEAEEPPTSTDSPWAQETGDPEAPSETTVSIGIGQMAVGDIEDAIAHSMSELSAQTVHFPLVELHFDAQTTCDRTSVATLLEWDGATVDPSSAVPYSQAVDSIRASLARRSGVAATTVVHDAPFVMLAPQLLLEAASGLEDGMPSWASCGCTIRTDFSHGSVVTSYVFSIVYEETATEDEAGAPVVADEDETPLTTSPLDGALVETADRSQSPENAMQPSVYLDAAPAAPAEDDAAVDDPSPDTPSLEDAFESPEIAGTTLSNENAEQPSTEQLVIAAVPNSAAVSAQQTPAIASAEQPAVPAPMGTPETSGMETPPQSISVAPQTAMTSTPASLASAPAFSAGTISLEAAQDAIKAFVFKSNMPTIRLPQVTVHAVNPLYGGGSPTAEITESAALKSGAATAISQKQAIEKIKTSMAARTATISFTVGTDANFVSLVDTMFYSALAEDGDSTHGDYIRWVWSEYGCSMSGVVQNGVFYIDYTYTVTYKTTAAQEKTLLSRVDSALSSLNLSSKSTYDKAKSIYDYIGKNVTYDYVHLGNSSYGLQYTAYAALINKTSVCQGYSSLFYLMATRAGLSVRVIGGTSRSQTHSWNIVKMDDGKWYNIDATWDAPNVRAGKTCSFFLLPNSTFADHTRGGKSLGFSEDYASSAFSSAYPMGSAAYVAKNSSTTSAPKTTTVSSVPKTGWQTINGKVYYYESGGKIATGWKKVSDKWYYMNASGIRQQSSWVKISNNWYYFNASGIMQTGWVTVSGKKYYCNANGVMQTGLQTISGKKYYFNSSGVMLTGWQTISKKKYYFNASGVMLTGWQTISKNKYYFNASGVMQTGWVTVSKKKYYMNSSGVMLTGWQTISKKKYYFNASGVMQTGWKKISNKWYYLNASGVMLTGYQKIGTRYYWLNKSTGAMTVNAFVNVPTTGNKTKRCYFDANGYMVTGEKKIGAYWYYFDPKTGEMAKSKYINLKSGSKTVKVYYDANGHKVIK